MSRILMLAQACAPVVGGVESHVEDLVHGLRQRGDAVQLLCGQGSSGPADEINRVIVSPAVRDADLFSAGALDRAQLESVIADTCLSFNPDVIHVHNPNHFDPALADNVLSRRSCPRVVASVHDRPAEPGCNGVLARDWDHVLFASRYLRDTLPTPPIHSVLHLGIDTDLFHPGVAPHPAIAALERPLIFHPARLLLWKGVLDSVEAFIEVRKRRGSGTLLLVASNNILAADEQVEMVRSEVLRRCEDAGIHDAVLFRDFARSEMPAAYAACDVVWYPTRAEEPFGLVPLEAMACGRAVVIASSGGMRETITDGRGGFVITAGDVRALAEKTVALLSNPRLRGCMEHEAARQAPSRSLESYLDQLRRIYQGGARR